MEEDNAYKIEEIRKYNNIIKEEEKIIKNSSTMAGLYGLCAFLNGIASASFFIINQNTLAGGLMSIAAAIYTYLTISNVKARNKAEANYLELKNGLDELLEENDDEYTLLMK